MDPSNRYILKYNQSGKLYNYIELSKYDKLLSYIKLDGNKLIRFDKQNNIKQLIEYKNPVELRQRFNDGQSFVYVYDTDKNQVVQYDFHGMTKQITLINNLVSTATFGQFIIEAIQRYKKEGTAR